MTEVVPVDINLDSPTQEERKTLGIRLINTIREKKVSEAKSLIDRKADIAHKDKLGCQSIHYAAQHGLLDVVEKLLDAGAHPNCFDSNGQAPLHKAAGAGHVDVVIMLVAYGAVVGTMDWDGQTPFEKAIISRHVDVAEILMSFGAEPNLQDWTWTMDDPGPKEKKLVDMIRDQIPLVTGYKYGGIDYEVVCGRPNQDMVFKKMRLVVQSVDVRNTYFMFCSKKQSEFTDLKSLLRGEEIPYSDMYEIKTWGITRKIINMTLTVEGIPKCNERIQLVSPEKDIGRVENFKKKEEENVTEVAIIIKLHTKRPTQFALTVVSKPETFVISQEQQIIQPSNEPDAEIDIPEGTFDKAAELQLNVVETRDVNEDEADESGPLLLTNVIDMTMSDGQQPKEEIVMKLPVHHKDEEEGEMCVLATSEEDPDSVDDWEVIQAQKDAKGNAVFKIDHFSIYAGASKHKVDENKDVVVEAIHRSLNKERKVFFNVFTQLQSETGRFEIILQCGTAKKMKKLSMQDKLEKQGYTHQFSSSSPFVVNEVQTFMVTFRGNIDKWDGTESNDDDGDDPNTTVDTSEGKITNGIHRTKDVVEFSGKKGFIQKQFVMIVINKETPVSGTIVIDKELRKIEIEHIMEVTPRKICKGKLKKKEIEREVVHYESLTQMDIFLVLPIVNNTGRRLSILDIFENQEDAKQIEVMLDTYESDNPSFVPGMDCRSLANIALHLNENEAHLFGINLGVNQSKLNVLLQKKNPALHIILEYRGKRPHVAQVESIKKALQAIDRGDLVTSMLV